MATVLLTYLLGRRLFSHRVGLVGCLLLAVWPNHIFFTTLLFTEVVFTAILLLALLLFVRWGWESERPGPVPLLALGGLLGLAALFRGEAVLLVLALAVALLWVRRDWHRALRFAVLVGLGMLPVVGLWTVRNIVVLHSPVVISTGAGENFANAHWEGATGAADWGRTVAVHQGYEELGPTEREVRLYHDEMSDGLKFLFTHPWDELQQTGWRLFYLLRADGSAIHLVQSRPAGAGARPVLGEHTAERLQHLSDGIYYLVLGFAVAGLPLALRRRPEGLKLLAAVCAYWLLLYGVLFIGEERYHVALTPLVSLVAAMGLIAVWEGYSLALSEDELR